MISKFIENLDNKKRTIRNIVVLASTAGTNQLFKFIAFKCPCISSAEQLNGENNYWYGIAYLVAPAIVLFIVGILLGVDVWKWLTGCCRRSCPDRESNDACRSCNCWHSFKIGVALDKHFIAAFLSWSSILAVALLAPSAWITVTLLDGDAMACAVTPMPYRFSDFEQTCDDVLFLQATDDYDDNKRHFQVIGWIVVAALSMIATLAFSITRCCSYKTYYQAKYQRHYRQIEQQAIETEIYQNQKLKEEKMKAAKEIVKDETTPKQWNKVLDLFILNEDIKTKKLENISNIKNQLSETFESRI
ncbi:calcium homeostasis modulator protein 6-like [Clavelina lepadiformis]|uniref:calcium homeostasis modulator protein 6-like n=1 Tax=Clavelina lepadiformis TaxID=159417 RepID=UPI0040415FD2